MSSSREYTNTRGTDNGGRQGKSSAAVTREVKKLFEQGATDIEALSSLRKKHGDSTMFNSIFDAYKERQEYISKKARKFKRVIYERYSHQNLTLPQLIKKARKYKNKYNLSTEEFEYFFNLVTSDRAAAGDFSLPNTKMSRVFGHTHGLSSAGKLQTTVKDNPILQEILKIHGESRVLHSQVVLQSLMYREFAPEAIRGVYRSDKHNPYSFVHPVIAALFLPHVQYLDRHMLIASISNIVSLKYQGKMISTQPDNQLYWQMVTDRNDLVCDINDPLVDLKNRTNLQVRLWENVFNLRRGNYYDNKLLEFMTAIDTCRNNVYDAPDLAYVRDEGTVLRKLLGAFSLRPTVVSTSPLYNIMTANPYVNPTSLAEIDSIPMITLRLPFTVDPSRVVHLDDAQNQGQWFIENKTLVPKTRNIIYSSDVLFFHINRRYQAINIARLTAPYNFNKLPMTVGSFQSVNDQPVKFSHEMTISGEHYSLRSVVIVKSQKIKDHQHLIVGCATLLVVPKSIQQARYDDATYLMYDPAYAGTFVRDAADDVLKQNKPITALHEGVGQGVETFSELVRTRGTIFMYEKTSRSANSLFRL